VLHNGISRLLQARTRLYTTYPHPSRKAVTHPYPSPNTLHSRLITNTPLRYVSEPAILSTPYEQERVQFSNGGIAKRRYPKAYNYPAQTSRYERISTFGQEQISTSLIDRSQILAPVLPLHPVAPYWQPASITIRQQESNLTQLVANATSPLR
jgi:hypothetical protein